MTKPNELIASWPEWSRANAEKVLASPAWRMPVLFGDKLDALKIVTMPDDELYLDIRFDEERHVLGIARSESLGDLHFLWTKRDALDSNLILALVERDCGDLFRLLEDVVRRSLCVDGIAKKVKKHWGASARLGLCLESGLAFSIDLSPELRNIFGDIAYLDPSHESIRSMTRKCRAHYASVKLSESEISALAPGDLLPLLPEYRAMAEWNADGFSDSLVHVCAAEETDMTFAAFADGKLPAIPPPGALSLIRGGRVVADGEISRIGGVECFRLTHLR